MLNCARKMTATVLVLGFGLTGVAVSDEVMTIKDNKVGIGKSNPEFLLHLRQADGTGAGFQLETAAPAAAQYDWFFQQNAVTGAFLVTPFEGGDAPLQVFPGAARTIRNTLVIRSGNVGIGTQSPQAKLDVNGAIYQRGSRLHADYVFEPGYKLKTIEEQAAFMWDNKYLPAVGPGEYDANGQAAVDLGARSRAMLEELEKAHIYIAALNERLKSLTDRLEKQSAEIAELKGQLPTR